MHPDKSFSSNRGFTLIELMIVVAILAIIASIAVPQYNNYITTSKLAEPKQHLLTLQTLMEQYYQDNRTYVTSPGSPATTADVMSALPGWRPGAPANLNFDYSIAETASTYTIQAKGKTASGLNAYTLSIDQNNVRSMSGGGSSSW